MLRNSAINRRETAHGYCFGTRDVLQCRRNLCNADGRQARDTRATTTVEAAPKTFGAAK